MNTIVVAEKARGKGVATALVKAVQAGNDRFFLNNDVRDPIVREAMGRTYERLGFTTDDEITYWWNREK